MFNDPEFLALTNGYHGDKSNPWDRWPGESPKAFAAFECYRSMPERSLPKLSRKLLKSTQLLARWSARYRWVDRVAAFDDFQARVTTERTLAGASTLRSKLVASALDVLDGLPALSKEEKASLTLMERLALLRTVSGIADVKAGAELAGQFPADLPAPVFEVQVTRPAEGMVGVQLEIDGQQRYGYVACDRLAEFRADYPDALIID